MNTEILEEVCAEFTQNPERLDIDAWGSADECTYCIAGLVVLKRSPAEYKRLAKSRDSLGWANRAALDLNMIVEGMASPVPNFAKATRLFNKREWPAKFREAYEKAATAEARAAAAVSRIRDFIKHETKEAVWPAQPS